MLWFCRVTCWHLLVTFDRFIREVWYLVWMKSYILPVTKLVKKKNGIFMNFCFYCCLQAMDMFDVAEGFPSLEAGLARIKCPIMVIGVQTDILFPIWQQRELSATLQKAGSVFHNYFTIRPYVQLDGCFSFSDLFFSLSLSARTC